MIEEGPLLRQHAGTALDHPVDIGRDVDPLANRHLALVVRRRPDPGEAMLAAEFGGGIAAEDRGEQDGLRLLWRIVLAHEPIDLALHAESRCCHFRSCRYCLSSGLNDAR